MKSAIDMFFEFVKPHTEKNPLKKYGVSFYGGEPLLAMDLLHQAVDFLNENYPDLYMPFITTNGTLLTKKNMEFLATNKFYMAVSIDGPKDEHDKYRIFPDGRGSFALIKKNLENLRKIYPEYYSRFVTAFSVLDWGTDIISVDQYFERFGKIVPPTIFANYVGAQNCGWYEKFNETDLSQHVTNLEILKRKFIENTINGRNSSSYLNALVGFQIIQCLIRPRLFDKRPSFLPFSGACIPGMKFCVQPDGKIDICERVNGTYPIGHVLNNAIDYERICDLIKQYRENILLDCPQCPVSKFCTICYAAVEGDGRFHRNVNLCNNLYVTAKNSLSDYISILEENPKAFLYYASDTVAIDKKALFM